MYQSTVFCVIILSANSNINCVCICTQVHATGQRGQNVFSCDCYLQEVDGWVLFNLIVFPVSADCIMAKNGNTLSYDGMERVHYVSALTFPKAKIEILEVYR